METQISSRTRTSQINLSWIEAQQRKNCADDYCHLTQDPILSLYVLQLKQSSSSRAVPFCEVRFHPQIGGILAEEGAERKNAMVRAGRTVMLNAQRFWPALCCRVAAKNKLPV